MTSQPEGLLISLEGLPMCGKTRQADRLYNWLDDQDIETIQCTTPGGTTVGRDIRHMLYGRPEIRANLGVQAEAFLLQADLAQLYEETILPALHHSKFVVLQEGGANTVSALQSIYPDNIPSLVNANNIIATKNRKPDVTFFIDCKAATIYQRAKSFCYPHPYVLHELELIRDFFFVQAQEEPDRIRIVNGENSLEAVYEDILFLLKPILKARQYDIEQSK